MKKGQGQKVQKVVRKAEKLGPQYITLEPQRKKKILAIGDAVAATGFSTVFHGILDRLVDEWDIVAIGINYHGDPHDKPFRIYPAQRGQDVFGFGRLADIVQREMPDVIFILQDSWNIVQYLNTLRELQFPLSRVVCYSPVDAENLRLEFIMPINGVSNLVSYTQFGQDVFRKSGFVGDSDIIPHGFDPAVYHPVSRSEARMRLGLPDDLFIVGLVGRNQARKRIDYAMQIVFEWLKGKPDSVQFLYHGAMVDEGWDANQMALHWQEAHGHIKKTFKIKDERYPIDAPGNLVPSFEGTFRFIPSNIIPGQGLTQEELNLLYNAMDVHISTSWGDGWALCTMESMACGVPNIVPDFSGLGEWTTGGAYKVPTDHRMGLTGGVNTVGAMAEKDKFINALDQLYHNYGLRRTIGDLGRKLVNKPEYRWERIASQFNVLFKKALESPVRHYGEWGVFNE